MLEVHRESGGFAPWNEICAMSRLLRGILNIPSEGSLVQRDGTIPLGSARWNLGFVCLGGRNARITVKCLPREIQRIFHWGLPR